MKKTFTKLLTILTMLMWSISASAFDFSKDGFYFYIENSFVNIFAMYEDDPPYWVRGVTIGEASASMAGDVEIPIEVTIPAVSFLYEEEPGVVIGILGWGVDGDSFSKNENITSVRIRTEHPFFIGDKAFSKCSNMKALIIDAWDMIKIGKNVVDEGTVTLYVQDFLVEDYKQNENCKVFAAIKSIREYNSGIDDIAADDAGSPNDIYTLQGVCIKRNATQEDIDALPAGLYIIGGKKVLVK